MNSEKRQELWTNSKITTNIDVNYVVTELAEKFMYVGSAVIVDGE
jgi:hypothetical protein